MFLMQFMECQKETAGLLRQRYEQQYRCEHPVHRLELTPELFLVLDGQTLADFGGDNWRQKLDESYAALSSIPVPTTGASVNINGTA